MIRTRNATLLSLLLMMMALPVFLNSSSAEAAAGFTEVKKLAQAFQEPGGPGWFGYDVAIDGDTAIASAREPWRNPPTPSGSASIFERNLGGPDNWGERVRLVPEDDNGPGIAGASTASVAIDGDTAVVGADFENARDGAVYIYGRNVGGPDNWGFVKRIEDADGKQVCCDGFGSSVAIDGDTIAVGELWADRVSIFERNEGGLDNWGLITVLTPGDGGPVNNARADMFFAVSIEGDTLVTGAPNHTHAGNPAAAGSVYVYDRNTGGSNNWGFVKEIFASDAAIGDQFGVNTALSGDTLIAGTSGNTQNAAYVFERNEGGLNNWGEVQKLVGGDVLATEKAGSLVGVSGDIAVLTHGTHNHLDSLGDLTNIGTIFVFERNEGGPNNWGETQELLPSDVWTWPSPPVDIDCGTIIVGDPNDGATGFSYIFEASNPPSCPGGADTTPPTITASRAPATANANGWNNEDVTVSYVAEDADSGIDADASDLTDDVVGEGENQTAEGTAVDNAGNSASASITGINVDKTDPTVTVSDQVARATSESGANVTYSGVSASDTLSGVDTFECSSPDGSAFPIGVTAVECTATDLAGNSSSGGFNVIVTGDCDCTEGVGFWKKQFWGKGKKKQIDDDTLLAYLSIVGLSSGVFGDMNLADANDVFNPPKSNNRGGNGSHSGKGSRSGSASGSGSSTGGSKRRGGSGNNESDSGSGTNIVKKQQKAERQLLAAWLNYAKGAVDWDEMIDTNGDGVADTEFGDLIGQVETLINDGDYEAAKDLAEAVNKHDKDNPVCDTQSGTGSGSDSNSGTGSNSRTRGRGRR